MFMYIQLGKQTTNLNVSFYYLQENGYNFDTYNGVQKVFGSLAVVIADNPASCAIGGFKESSSAYRPCRHCLGTAEEIKIYVS